MPKPLLHTAKLDGMVVTFDNSEEYHRLKREIFSEHLYYFETTNPQPVIIDAGAHIGLATLYFKKLFPGAQITAIEPHPATFRLLEENIWQNNLNDVTTENVALASHTGRVDFFSDTSDDHWFSTAGFLPGAWNSQQKSMALTVPTKPLATIIEQLAQPIDCLKMDIEGAESAVLMAAEHRLSPVKLILLEYHPHAGQDIKNLVEFLSDQGFEVSAEKAGKKVDPLTATGLFLLTAQRH